MSLIGNSLVRGILSKQLYSALRLSASFIPVHPQRCNYVTTVVTTKNIAEKPDAEQTEKMNKAAKVFLERAREYDEMIEEAGAEYRIGMRHLANMMGADPETFTQQDANAAIEYLFPSGIFDKKARPFMKPPEEVFPARKKIQFDKTGRPFHYMFFTRFPHYYEMCHEAVENLKSLDTFEDKEIRENKEPNAGLQLNLTDSVWLTKEQLQDKIIEEITDKQYEEFLAIMDRLLNHPYSYRCKDFLMNYRHVLRSQQEDRSIIQPKVGEDGRQYVTTYECRFKSAMADVTVIVPGTGKVEINGEDINGFEFTQPKEAVSCLFPVSLHSLQTH